MRLLDRAVEETATLWVIFQNHTGFFAFHIRGSYCSCFRSPACRCLSWNGWNLVVVVVFLHINSLSNVHPYITCKAAGSIAVCLILSKLDYCNGLLSGLPQKQIKRLLLVQNCAVRAVMKCKKKEKKDHVIPILKQLHWVPNQIRTCHKIISVTYRSVREHTPSTSLISP